MSEPLRLLLIEDETFQAPVIRQALEEKLGALVEIARTGEEGLEAFRRQPYDVVLLDYVLPGLSGLDVLHQIRAMDARTPVIIITGLGAEEVAVAALKAGATDYVVKQRQFTELLPAAISQALEQRALAERNEELNREVQRWKDLYEALVESSDAFIMGIDLQGRISAFNRRSEEVTGYRRDEVLGQPWETLVAEWDRAPLQAQIREQVSTGGRLRSYPFYIGTSGGPFRQVAATFTPLRDSAGTPMGMMAVGQDITERRRTEHELAERNKQLLALQRIGQAASQSLQIDAVLDLALAAVRDVLGMPIVGIHLLEEGAGKLVLHRSHGLPADHVEAISRLPVDRGIPGKVLQSGVPLVVPDLLAHPGLSPRLRALAERDQIRWIASVPLQAKAGIIGTLSVAGHMPGRPVPEGEIGFLAAIGYSLGMAIDNARLMAEAVQRAEKLEHMVQERTQNLVEANRSLEEANRHKSEFLANMSHELRTPLNAVLGFSEILADQNFGPLNEKQQRYVAHIEGAGRHLLALISDILDLAKIESGRLDLQVRAIPVRQTLAEAIALAKGMAGKKGIPITLEAPEDLPSLSADPVRVKQILYNLLSNAVKFTPQGGTVTLTARRVGGRQSAVPGPGQPMATDDRGLTTHGDFVEIAVQDTGIGFAEQDQARLFQTFVQLEGPYSKREAGTGLGLALTKRLVELHGGTIYASSPGPGFGATFAVRLPVVARPRSPRRILLAEDDGILRESLRHRLAAEGFEVWEAAGGEEALVRAAEGPDLMILDLGLPTIPGREVLRRLREAPAPAKFPILVMTGFEEAEAETALTMGAQEFLTKPFSWAVLMETINRLLEGRGAASKPDVQAGMSRELSCSPPAAPEEDQ